MPATCGSSSLTKHVCFFLGIRKSYNTYAPIYTFELSRMCFLHTYFIQERTFLEKMHDQKEEPHCEKISVYMGAFASPGV